MVALTYGILEINNKTKRPFIETKWWLPGSKGRWLWGHICERVQTFSHKMSKF